MIKYAGDPGEWVRESWVNEHHYQIIGDALDKANAPYRRASYHNRYSTRPSKAKQQRIEQAQLVIREVIAELAETFKVHDRIGNFDEERLWKRVGLDKLPLSRYWNPK